MYCVGVGSIDEVQVRQLRQEPFFDKKKTFLLFLASYVSSSNYSGLVSAGDDCLSLERLLRPTWRAAVWPPVLCDVCCTSTSLQFATS